MIVSKADIEDIQLHWAISSIEDDDRKRAFKRAEELWAIRAVGHQIEFEFKGGEADDGREKDDELFDRVALAYELAAIEGLDALSRPDGGDSDSRKQSAAASYRAFDIRRLTEIPRGTDERIFHVLQLSALAYCGDRGSDLRRWFEENPSAIEIPTVADALWDRRLLYRLFDCWIRLLRKKGWDDLDRIREIIAGLREDQRLYEEKSLIGDSKSEAQMVALRLISLYHWAKATEILAEYMLQGQPQTIFGEIDRHFESGIKAATASGDMQHEMILRWLHAVGRIMVTNSLWWATRTVNSKVSEFVKALTKNEHRAMFELLPPQRAALLEQGLLDQAKTAIAIDMPTSGGKTLLAQFRILQALNQFQADKGWVAYVAPTKALAAQITRRLRRDFEPMGLRVEQLSGAIEVDTFEDDLLKDEGEPLNVLVATPEKLSLVIRNKRVDRPLSLVVMDEAHNIENEERGLRIELLLATIKGDCPQANFLLLMPYVEKSENLARWLAQDIDAGRAISLGTAAWNPNERIVGLYRAVPDDSERAGWRLEYETLTVTGKAMNLKGIHRVGDCKPINIPKSEVLDKSEQKGFGLQTAAMATVMSSRGTSIAVANRIETVWKMAGNVAKNIGKSHNIPNDVRLVQDFLKVEFGSNFQLIDMLDSGVGVHHAGLSDEVRALMEWLAESGHLRVLCATSTIAQGINFPVSSVFLSSRFVPKRKGSPVEISSRDFWNLVGRAGRIEHDSVGVVGIAEGSDRNANIEFISKSTGYLTSRLVTLLNELEEEGRINELKYVIYKDRWEDFRCYVAHLWAQKHDLDAVLGESENLLRQTYGYTVLRSDPSQSDKASLLLEATRDYVLKLSKNPGAVTLADSTGFSPEGVKKAMREIDGLEKKLRYDDWEPESLFGKTGRMADLFGIMLRLPRLDQPLKEISGKGDVNIRLSNITRDWVNGVSLQAIAKSYFSKDSKNNKETDSLTQACKAIYRTIVNNGTWGVSALSLMSGMDFDKMSEEQRRRINSLPAMIYHGVRSEDAVLMRMNAVPRSIAESLGSLYKERCDDDESRHSVGKVRRFLKNASESDWDAARPADAVLGGEAYRRIWKVLSGES